MRGDGLGLLGLLLRLGGDDEIMVIQCGLEPNPNPWANFNFWT